MRIGSIALKFEFQRRPTPVRRGAEQAWHRPQIHEGGLPDPGGRTAESAQHQADARRRNRHLQKDAREGGDPVSPIVKNPWRIVFASRIGTYHVQERKIEHHHEASGEQTMRSTFTRSAKVWSNKKCETRKKFRATSPSSSVNPSASTSFSRTNPDRSLRYHLPKW